MRRILTTAVLCFAACLCLTASASAHEFHTTFTTIEHNIADKNIEITIKSFIHDLEPTFAKRFGKKIDLGEGPSADKLIFDYITENFEIKTSEDEVLEPVWVGKELEAQVAYFYLEIPFAGDLSGATVTNTMFFESFKEQVNYVSANVGESKTDLVFKIGDKGKQLGIFQVDS